MKTNKKMTFKLMTLMAAVFFSFSTAFAQPGAIDIIMCRACNSSSTSNMLQVPVEQNELYSIVVISKSGEKFTKKIRLTSRSKKLNLDLPPGFYKVIIVEVATGLTQKHTINLL